MNISRTDLQWAVTEGFLSNEQADALWQALEGRTGGRQKFDLAHVAYYAGALIVISAMGWFMTLGWERFGGGGIFLLSAVYALAFAWGGWLAWNKGGLKVPGGLLVTMAVGMTPLAIYGLERMTGIWPQGDPGTYRDYHVWVKGSWILMEVGTILAALIALRFVRFPFLTAPAAFSLWYMSMDLAPLFLGKNEFNWNERLWVSLIFGLAVLLVSVVVDRRTEEDYAFWMYLFGMLSFWGGLSLMNSGSEWAKFGYAILNGGLILLSVLLERRVFIVFGGLGVFGYLGHLSYRVFKDSALFPVALSLLGLSVISLGVLYQRHRVRLQEAALACVPNGLRWALPQRRDRRL